MLRKQLLMVTCEKCDRYKHCKQVVLPDIHYSGDRPDVFCLGESPGYNEDIQGKPFVGNAGGVLRVILNKTTNNYILDNSNRCFAEYKPKSDELMACRPNWVATVKKYKPKVIVALGNYAVEAIFNRKVKIGTCVGQVTTISIGGDDYPVVLSYHPSYISRIIKEKKGGEKILDAWINTWEIIKSLIVDNIRVRTEPEVTQLTEHREILGFLDKLNKGYNGIIAYDYETVGDKDALRPELNEDFKIVSIGVGVDERWGGIDTSGVSFLFDTIRDDVSLDIQCAWQKIIDGRHQKVAQNAKYEHKCNIKRFGYTKPLHDTMLAMNVINELASANLGAIGGYCKIPWSGYKFDMAGTQKNPLSMLTSKLLKYSALEGALTYKIWLILYGIISDKVDAIRRKQVLQMQETFAYHLAYVEMDGMHIDQREVVSVRNDMNKLLSEAKKELFSLKAVKKLEEWAVENIKSFKKGHHFNPVSSTQVHHLVLNTLRVPVRRPKWGDKEKDKNGKIIYDGKGKPLIKYVLNKDVLSRYEEQYPALKSLLKVRSLSAMLSGFLNKYENFTGPDGCVHTNYTQVVVVTGRLSSTAPNLQNVPLESVVRRAFNSRYKHGWLVAADYIQLEPVLLAGWSGDKAMCEALNKGKDLHRFVGSKIYNVEYDAVTTKQRWIAKRRNLGSMYGQTAEGLAEAANIPLDEAIRIINIYDKTFIGVKKFRMDRGKEAARYGKVVDLFGAVRHLHDAQSNERGKKARAERQAGNFPIQSTGNRFHLIAMCVERDLLERKKIQAVVVGVEHDKIFVDCANNALGATIDTLYESMLIHNDASYWRDKPVPVNIDIKYGKNMYELKEWEPKNIK